MMSQMLVIIVLFLHSTLVISSFLQGDKIACTEEGKIIEFSFLEQNPCIKCQCRNGTVDCYYKNHCQTQNIPELTTESSSSDRRSCVHSGRSYQNAETWQESCQQCTCLNGHTNCETIKCRQQQQHHHHHHRCPVGNELLQYSTNNDCCRKCIPTMLNTSPTTTTTVIQHSAIKQQQTPQINALIPDRTRKPAIFGTCTLDSDNYVRTFDDRYYPLIGRCNYAFVRDCSSSSSSSSPSPSSSSSKRLFSLHIVQKYAHGRNILLRLRLRDKVIYFSHLGRVRINKQLIKLPYLQFGQYSIVQKNSEIRFKAMFGLEIRYLVNRTVEIKIKNSFTNKLCGLCGNFNGTPVDDLRAKRSKNIVDLERFLYSFKVGKTPFCPRRKRLRTMVSKPVLGDYRERRQRFFNRKQTLQLQSRQAIVQYGDSLRPLSKFELRRRYPIGMV